MAITKPIGEQICELAVGRLLAWRGLRPFLIAAPPGCLHPTGAQGWLPFDSTPLLYQVFREGSAASEVWLFSGNDKDVCLVEVFHLPFGLPVSSLLEALGTCDLEYCVSLTACLQRPEQLQGSDLHERVYSGRGLALVTRPTKGGSLELVRVRGFELMPAVVYRERFVDLPGVRFLPD